MSIEKQHTTLFISTNFGTREKISASNTTTFIAGRKTQEAVTKQKQSETSCGDTSTQP